MTQTDRRNLARRHKQDTQNASEGKKEGKKHLYKYDTTHLQVFYMPTCPQTQHTPTPPSYRTRRHYSSGRLAQQSMPACQQIQASPSPSSAQNDMGVAHSALFYRNSAWLSSFLRPPTQCPPPPSLLPQLTCAAASLRFFLCHPADRSASQPGPK